MKVDGEGEIRLVLNRAVAAARRTSSAEITPGHLLLGILDLPGSRGAALLEELGLDLDQVRRAVGFLMDFGLEGGAAAPTLSASSIAALQAADGEATGAGAPGAASDDLVLALAGSGSLVTGILESLGVTQAAIRSAIARTRGEGPEEERLDGDEAGSVAEQSDEGSRPAFMSPEWAEDLRNRSENMDLFPGAPGALVRVVAIGQVVTASGLDVQLTALEVRAGMMFVHWRASSTSARWLGGPDVEVSDPLGTRYGVMAGSGSGDDHEWTGELWIFPAVPGDASELTIEIQRFGEPSPLFHLRDIPHEALPGPWRFVVAL